MAFVWTVVLVIWGFAQGWSTIPALMWWLILPFMLQDTHDMRKPKSR